jgi:hypothetical protein
VGPEAFASTGLGAGIGNDGSVNPAAFGQGAGQPAQPMPVAQAPVLAPPVAAGPGGKRELVGFLVSYQSDTYGAYWPLYAGRNLVGRAGAADGLDIEISDPTTSSNHAALHVESGNRSVLVEDLGSTNGSFVNDDPLGPQGRREVRDNDRVRFGGFGLVVKVVPRV